MDQRNCESNRLGHLSIFVLILTLSASSVRAQQDALSGTHTNADTNADTDSVSLDQSLPQPKHPGRVPECLEVSRPEESQPNREKRSPVSIQSGRAGSMATPGRPSRNLPRLGGANYPSKALGNRNGTRETKGGEVERDELPSDEVLGMLRKLPHKFRDGGINFECIYTGESFTKARGGINPTRPTNYRSNLDLVGTLDTTKMGWWENGRFFVYGQNLSGRPLSVEEVGDVQLFSNLDSTINTTERPHFTTIAEYWYEQLTLDEALRIKIGKQDANADFASTDLGGDFVHSSFGLPPMIPLPSFPSQALGIATFLGVTKTFKIGFGVYDGTLPSGPQGVRWGFDTLGHNGAITLYQLEWKPQLGSAGQFPSTIRAGLWHHSDKNVWSEQTANQNPITYHQNYGVWTTFDQMLWKESGGEDNDQGLGIFGQFGWAPGNRNPLQEYYGVGLVYKGLMPGRNSDLIGFGVANVLFSGDFREMKEAAGVVLTHHETAVELFYKFQFSKFISLQPDLQYIANPGGRFKDALLPGLRFEMVL